jgi:YbbR domain-containing protein
VKNLLAQFDVGRAIVALLIAVTFFAVVRNETNPSETASFEVPVDLVDVPSGLLLTGREAIPSVRVRITGPRDSLVDLRSSSVRAFVDLRRATSGLDEYPVSTEFPDPRIQLLEVVPVRIPVRLEETIQRAVLVRVTRTGNVPFGYEAGQPQVEPTGVIVDGPTSLVRRVESVSVEVKLDAVTVDVDGSYRLTPLDSQGQPVVQEGRNLRINPESVRVRVPIAQQLSYKTVAVRPSVTGNVQTGFALEGVALEPAVVTLVGTPRALGNVNFAETETVDATDASQNFARQVSLRLPEGLSLLQPDLVRVTVRVTPLTVAQPFPTPLRVENLGPGLVMTSTLPPVQVALQGPAPILRGLDPTDVRSTLDLDGLGPGLHQVQVRARAPDDVRIQSIVPEVVSVTLEAETRPTGTPPPAAVPEAP